MKKSQSAADGHKELQSKFPKYYDQMGEFTAAIEELKKLKPPFDGGKYIDGMITIAGILEIVPWTQADMTYKAVRLSGNTKLLEWFLPKYGIMKASIDMSKPLFNFKKREHNEH